MSDVTLDPLDDFDKEATPVGKRKCCTWTYADHVRRHAAKASSGIGGTWTEFKLFITKGNVFQMAIGFILALQFNEVVKSLTNDIIMPPIGMAIGNNLLSLFVVIKLGKSYFNQSNKVDGVAQLADPAPPPYLSIVQAQADGAVTWNYGQFFQVCVNFIIVALILFCESLLLFSFPSLTRALWQCW